VGAAWRIFCNRHFVLPRTTRALEREIDELVYALYGLTPEEKVLVQAAAK
jgi:hypothetical protein